MSKCQFLKKQVKYLGHIITSQGIIPDPEKVECINNMPTPNSVRDVRSLIGCLSYYRKYIASFANIAEPLTALTRKHAEFKWGPKQQESLRKLKHALMHAPVLAIPDLQGKFQLYTDSSDLAVGAVLVQEQDGIDKPVAYLSHQLNKTQRKWAIIEKEAYAIVYALGKFRHYLYGQDFPIYCDHKPLS